jgi:type VI protein secretion system component VasF
MNGKHDTDMNEVLQKTVIDSLNESIEHLDAHTLSRLNQARHHALAQAEKPRLFNPHWLKAASFAVLLVTIINGWLFFSNSNIQQMNTDDFEMIVANEDFELLQDLDFVVWMIEEEHAS